MNYEKNLAALDKQIECKKRELSELRQKRRELKIAEIRKNKKPKPRGRPRISEDLLIEAVELAKTRTLPHVALKMGISLKTLYRYNIKRYVLNGETRRQVKYEAKIKE